MIETKLPWSLLEEVMLSIKNKKSAIVIEMKLKDDLSVHFIELILIFIGDI